MRIQVRRKKLNHNIIIFDNCGYCLEDGGRLESYCDSFRLEDTYPVALEDSRGDIKRVIDDYLYYSGVEKYKIVSRLYKG